MKITVRCAEDMRSVKVTAWGGELVFEELSPGEEVTVSVDGCDVSVAETDAVQAVPDSEALSPVTADSDSGSGDLFVKLSGLRREIASSQGVPPYVIFNDKSLREMARVLPADLDAFGRISGVGESKLEKYGDTFINAIASHTKESE